MKSHISVTIDRALIEKVERYRREEKRSRSQVFEMALECYFASRNVQPMELLTSPARFQGTFDRSETYER